MAERTVSVKLLLNAQGYMQGVDAAAQKTSKLGTEAEKLAQKKQAFTQLGAAATAVGVAFGVGIGVAVAKAAEFDQAMSFVQARTHESAENMDLLRDAALDAGARTVFSATEAANAIEELAAAGVSTGDILSGGLDSALDLAAAGGLGVAEAAGIAATALKTFNLQGEDMAHVADLLAAGAGKAMGDVSQLSQALAQGGQVAKQTGLSIEETTAGLSAFAAQGLLGSDAGTSFKSMLQRLTPQSNEARDKMDALGISAYDASGQFIGLAEFAGNLESSLRELTPEQRNAAMATIFGSDAVRAANVLYTEGEEGIRDWIAAVDDQGYAAETAAMRLDNLAGDVEALGGALDTALIQTGSGANDALRSLVQSATGAVDVFNALPVPLQETAMFLGIAATGVSLVGGAALLATPRIAEFRSTVAAAGLSMKGLSLAAGGVSVAIAGAMIVFSEIARLQAEARAQTEAYVSTLEKGTHRITAATREQAVAAITAEQSWLWVSRGSAADAAEKFGLSLDTVADAALRDRDALAQMADILAAGEGQTDAARRVADEYGLSLGEVSAASTLLSRTVLQSGESLEDAQRIAEQSAEAQSEAAAETLEHEAALAELAGQAVGASDSIDGLADAIRGFGSATLDARAAERDFQAAIDDLTASLADNGTTLDTTTEAGRANGDAIDDLVKSTLEYSAAVAEQTGDQEAANAVIAAGRSQLIAIFNQLGITGAEAEAYADSLGLIPGNIPTWTELNGVAEAEASLAWLTRSRSVLINPTVAPGSAVPGIRYANADGNLFVGGKPKEFAAGGFASGIYPYTPGGIHKFAEEHDEAYISLDPARRARSLNIWEETGRMLGAGIAPTSSAVALAAQSRTSAPDVYVQNPWTGEYLLAKTQQVADGRIKVASRQAAVQITGGESSL
ncbi:phage tail tape measure protein [Microbacterium aquimaris]|uniref:phage tail tape measure protein n=1 Tax=Microbacterium aquimaris TaxID=459816 RepID=UPI002AD41A91|nr:phage tail tape measure protein [Microbacterium aquimaris]MDZ8275666.1 phage tail tape measure protein [Microbacterium aquimaris]